MLVFKIMALQQIWFKSFFDFRSSAIAASQNVHVLAIIIFYAFHTKFSLTLILFDMFVLRIMLLNVLHVANLIKISITFLCLFLFFSVMSTLCVTMHNKESFLHKNMQIRSLFFQFWKKLKINFKICSMHVKKCAYANTRQSKGIRLRLQNESTGLNEQLPALLFQRSTIQTNSMQEEARVNQCYLT